MDLNGFNAMAVEPQTSYEPMPADWYKCVIIKTEEKPTKKQNGSYLQLDIEVIEGKFAGRKVFERLNLNNPNSTAVEIAQRALSSICRAIDVPNPQDSDELLDKPLMVKVAVKPADEEYSASNEVKGYDAAGATASAPVEIPVAAAAANGSATPPWKR